MSVPIYPETLIRTDEKHYIPDFGEIWKFRDLLLILTVRDMKLRYKQTVLGVLWVVLQPFLTAIILAVIFGYFAHLPSDGIPYIVFVFSALVPWFLFSGVMARAGNSVLKDAPLVSKIYFPRIILPLASSLAVLIDFAVTLAVMLVLLLVYHVPLSANIIFLPFLTILVMLTGMGCSFFFSALSVYYRDFVHVMPFVVQVWFYASPIVYSTTLVPLQVRQLYALNPWVGLINGFRWSIFGGEIPWRSLSISIVGTLVIFVIGTIVFEQMQRNFVDVV